MSESNMVTVDGIVAQRDGRPYVQLKKNGELFAQFSIAEARSVAMDLLRAASYAETDAHLIEFFKEMDLPIQAVQLMLLKFRAFRFELDTEPVETSYSSPDGEKGLSNA